MRAEFRVVMSFLLMYDIKKKNTNTQQTNKQTNNDNNNNNKKTKTKQVSYSLTPTVMN